MNKLELTYNNNLNFFKEHIPSVYKEITENSQNPQITIDPNNGDIQLLSDENPIYSQGAVNFALKEVDKFLNKIKEFNYSPGKFSTQLRHLIKISAFKKTFKYYSENRKHTRPDTVTRLDLMIFGVGLGYHVEMLINKRKYKQIVIVENDMRKFKASLYTIHWDRILSSLPDNNLISFVLNDKPDNRESFYKKMERQCYSMFPSISVSTTIYNHQPFKDDYKDIKPIISEFTSHMQVMYERIGPDAHRLMNANENSRLNHNLIDLVNSKIEGDNFKIAIVGAGPSLDIYSDELKNNRDKFFIISVGSGLSSMLDMGLTPNLHLELEYKRLAGELLEYLNTRHPLDEIELICTIEANPRFVKLFKNVRMFVPESSELADIFPSNLVLRHGGVNCANGAIAIASNLTKNDIYLFGIDLAFTGGEHHSKTNISNITNTDDLPGNLYLLGTGHTDMIPVISTQGETIYAKPTQNSSRIAMEQLLKVIGNKVYNCSHGTKIEGSEYLDNKTLFLNFNKNAAINNIQFNEEKVSCSKVPIHKTTLARLKIAFKVTDDIYNGLSKNIESNELQIHKIFLSFSAIGQNYSRTMGLYRLIMSVNRTPLLQLYILLNYLPSSHLQETMKIWLKEYKEYKSFIENKLMHILNNENHYVSEEWTEAPPKKLKKTKKNSKKMNIVES